MVVLCLATYSVMLINLINNDTGVTFTMTLIPNEQARGQNQLCA